MPFRAKTSLSLAVLFGCIQFEPCGATLDDLPAYKNFTAHRESSYDRGGGNFDMRPVEPGETRTVAELSGPGCITHIWFTHMYPARAGLRKLVLRAYFDGAETPCIESPLGDFFGLGHAQTYTYASEALAVGTWGGLNSFWRMPFGKSARITVTNDGKQRCNALYYYVDYEKYDSPQPEQPCFHAQYRQEMPCTQGKPYTILEATGRGHYVGCNLSIEQGEESWWGEGDDNFYIDGETTPSLVGTGSEDYFSGAWCYWNEFAYPYFGMPFRGRKLADGTMDRFWPHLRREDAKEWHWPVAWRTGDLWNVYRYHVADPIPFRKSLKMDIEHGYINNERRDHYSSVAYWYQSEPHAPQPKLAPVAERIPMYLRLQERGDGLYEAEDMVDNTTETEGQVSDPDMTFWGKAFSRSAMLEWNPEKTDSVMSVPLIAKQNGAHDVTVKFVHTRRGGSFAVSANGRKLKDVQLYQDAAFPTITDETFAGVELTSGTNELSFTVRQKAEKSEGNQLGIDLIKIIPAAKQ